MSLAWAGLAAVFAALSWAVASLLFGRILRGDDARRRVTAPAANLFKNLLAGLVFLGCWAIVREPAPEGEALAWLFWSGVAGFAVGDSLYFAAIPRCGAQTASMVGLLNVPIAALLAYLVLGEELAPGVVGFMLLTLLGVTLVILDPVAARRTAHGSDRRGTARGVVFALIAALVYASAILAGHAGFGDGGVLPATVVRLAGGVAGGLVIAIFAGLLGLGAGSGRTSVARELADIVRPIRTPGVWRRLGLAALFGSVLGLLPFHYALRELPGGLSPVLFSTTPLFLLPLGFLFGERHGARGIVGTLIGFAGVAGIVVSLGQSPAGSKRSELTVKHVASPAGHRSMGAFLTPTPDGGAMLSWLEREDRAATLLCADWNGRGWTTPVAIARGDDWFVNWADFPAVAAGARGARIAAWLAKNGPGTFAYGVHHSCSRDGGATWDAPRILHTDRSETEHGFVSLTALPGGEFAAVWLDGRNTGAGSGGAMALFTAVVGEAGAAGGEIQLDERVCDCCQTSAVLAGDGTLVVAYRDRSADEVRDIAVVRGRPGSPGTWSEPRTVNDDGWKIAGCPVNGPALAARGTDVALAWFTVGAEDEPRVLVALSHDAGLTFGSPMRIGFGRPLGRVDVVYLADGALLVSWLEATDGAAEWRVRTLGARGVLGAVATIAEVGADRASGFLRMAPVRGGALAAFTDDATETVRIARLVIGEDE
ncbi:MAG: hypothetical protein E2O39_09045 [Planctomycetota bacterium]|nr:MAG: hypothetical protein E2O39_09045 [Planctomycetota bacterium]